ncbi:hypothetical protein JCM15579A_04360 [Marinifilum fragile]|jgi:hypothetical protein
MACFIKYSSENGVIVSFEFINNLFYKSVNESCSVSQIVSIFAKLTKPVTKNEFHFRIDGMIWMFWCGILKAKS